MEKLRVISLDDETLTRKLIRMKVDWERLNLEMIAEFSSSKKALEQIEVIKPDVVITDICMPGMDGIEFSEECIAILPNVKIMILTGHDEFSFAKRSIHIGVSDYILKPINEEEINKSLSQMINKIHEERSLKTDYQYLMTQIEENLPTFREKYLNQVLIESDSVEIFGEKMNYYRVNLNPESTQVQVAVLKIEGTSNSVDRHMKENSEIILYLRARELTEEFFSGDKYMVFCRDGLGRIVVICNNPEIPLLECLELLRKMLITRLKCYVTIGLGLGKEDYSQLSSGYKEAVQALDYKVIAGSNAVIYYDEITKGRIGNSSQEEAMWNETKIYIRAGLEEKAGECIHRLWETYKQDEEKQYYRAKNMFIEISTWCFNESVRQDLPDKEMLQEKMKNIIEAHYSIGQYEEEAFVCVTKVAKEMALREAAKGGNLIHNILSYMSKNIADPELSMNRVAEHAFISTGYLGRTLKKYTGKTYGEYLSELRFNKATELLKNTDLKGYEIGERIGILDAHYLSIWFKKMSGHSLSDYRRMISVQKNENLYWSIDEKVNNVEQKMN